MPRHERLPAYRVLSHLVVMVVVAAVLGVVVAGLAIPFAGLTGMGARNVARTMDNLPEELKTSDLSQRSTILDASGHPIASLYDQNRTTVPLTSISRTMVKAIVAIEDYRFYQHGAIDLKGTLRALVTNQANSGVVQGGSSITQQLVKLTLQSQAKTKAEQAAATADTYARKLKELRYAIALEQSHSKDWILARYLNTAYFGDGAYGVQAAAKHYFNVNARDLNLRQSSLLAGLVKNPYGYDPTKFEARATDRRNVVLDRMAELNVVSRTKAEKNKQRDLGLDVQDVDNGCLNSTAPFFCSYVLSYLLQDTQLGSTEAERKNVLKNGGLTIQTTLDMTAQHDADAAVADHVGPTDGAIGAMAIEVPGTGDVAALAQSRPMGNRKKLGQTYVNFTVPEEYGGANGFQPGSTFKVFTLATALMQGYSLATQFDSESPMTFDQADFANCPGAGSFVGPYIAHNDTGTGWFNMYSGTRSSINTFYLQLEEKTGVCQPYELAQQLGVKLTDPGVERYPTFTLGVTDASPLEMAEAYATFAARGVHCASRPVTQITDANGNVLRDYPPQCTQVVPANVADAVSDVLRGVIEGGFASAQQLSVAAAGKTGTTNDQKAVWFCGYTAHYAAAATVAGIDDLGRPSSLIGKVVDGSTIYEASGSQYAAPIWGDALKPLTAGMPYDNFTYPVGIEGAGVTAATPPAPPKPQGGGHGGHGHGHGR
jgi:membrane peptidoglycan carboxypeptidase